MAVNSWFSNSMGSFYGSSSSNVSGISGLYGLLSDRSAIKNGSYSRLLKTYYGSGQSSSTETSSKKSRSSDVVDKILEEKKNPKVSKEAQEANTKLTESLSNINKSVATLQNDSTYENTENGQSATSKVVSAMKSFVSDYNDVVTSAKNSTLTNKTAYVANMMGSTSANADKLAEIGVTLNSDGTLLLDETKLKSADLSKVQDLFSSKNIISYGSTIASRIKFAGGTSSTSSSKDTNNEASSSASSLKEDGRTLASDKIYEKITDKDGNEVYDVNKIFSTAKSFVNNYNNMLNKAESSTNSGALSNLARIKETTAHYADALKEFGFSVDSNGRLKLDEDTFKKSDMSKVQELFKDYGSSISTSASLVDYYMSTQADASSGYTSTAAYNLQSDPNYLATI